MNQRGKRLQIGLFVVTALVLLAGLILLFNSLPRLFQPSKLYTIRFDEAPGIAQGTPVRRFGVRIGEVRQVSLDEERGIVRVQIAIDPQFTLRRNEQPTLSTGLIGSGAVIDFLPQAGQEGQPPDRTPLAPGAEVVGVRQATIGTLLGQASEVVPNTQQALNDMRKSMQRLEQLSPVTEQALREYRDLAREINRSIPDLRRTNDEYQRLAREARQAIPDLRRTSDDIGSAARSYGRLGERLDVWVQANQESITRAVNQLNTTLGQINNILSPANQRNLADLLKNLRTGTERLDPTLRSIDDTFKESQRAIQHLDRSLSQLDQVVSDLQKASRPLGQRSETITRNLDETMAKLNQTASDLNALMQAIDRRDGTLQRLLSDPSLFANLNATACQIANMMPKVNRMIKDLEIFGDKLARHPELIGVRGALRPSDGLKELPKPYNPPGTYPSAPLPGPMPPGSVLEGPPPGPQLGPPAVAGHPVPPG